LQEEDEEEPKEVRGRGEREGSAVYDLTDNNSVSCAAPIHIASPARPPPGPGVRVGVRGGLERYQRGERGGERYRGVGGEREEGPVPLPVRAHSMSPLRAGGSSPLACSFNTDKIISLYTAHFISCK